MALIHKGTSPTTPAASFANSLKSTGPATERGQLVSRRNALKHWGRAEAIRPSGAALVSLQLSLSPARIIGDNGCILR